MDPNATLRLIHDALAACERYRGNDVAHRLALGNDLDEYCQTLWDWLDRGGFEPNWAKYPLASSYYRCRAVSHARGERV